MLQEIFRIPLPHFLQNWIGKDHIPVFGYGLMIVLGFLAGAQLMKYLARRHGFDGETFVNAALLALVSGVIGARLSHVFENWSAFTDPNRSAWDNFKAMLNVSSGGLTFYGGFLLATPVLVFYALWKRVPVLKGMDIVAPCLMLGLAFGRMGCFLNGCCHGEVCNLPWAVQFPYGSNAYIEHYEQGRIHPPPELQSNRKLTDDVPALKSAEAARRDPKLRDLAAHEHSQPVHPTQLYSVFNALLICVVLVAFLTTAPAPGRVFALMLMLKGASRYALEMLRVEPAVWGRLSYSMVLSIFLVAAGIGMWLGCGWLARRPRISPPRP